MKITKALPFNDWLKLNEWTKSEHCEHCEGDGYDAIGNECVWCDGHGNFGYIEYLEILKKEISLLSQYGIKAEVWTCTQSNTTNCKQERLPI